MENLSFEAARKLPLEVECSAIGAFVNTLPTTVPTSWSWFNFNTIFMIIGTTAVITTISLLQITPTATALEIQEAPPTNFKIERVDVPQPERLAVFAFESLPKMEFKAPRVPTDYPEPEIKVDFSVSYAPMLATQENLMPDLPEFVPMIASAEIEPDSLFIEINRTMSDREIREVVQYARENGVSFNRCTWRRNLKGEVKKLSMGLKANGACFQSVEMKGFESIRFDWKMVGEDVVEFHRSVNGGQRGQVNIADNGCTRSTYKFSE